jgi:hypothetical protein
MLQHLPGGDVARPVAELLDGLDRIFDWGVGLDSDPAKHRARYINAFLLLGKFLDQVTSRDFAHEFVHLAAALYDLDHGTVHSLLTPAAIDSRPVDGTEIWMARAKIALSIEIFLRAGKKPRDVREILTKHAQSIRGLVGRGKDVVGAAMYWHKIFMQEKVKNEIATEVFRRKIADLKIHLRNLTPAKIDCMLAAATRLLGGASSAMSRS